MKLHQTLLGAALAVSLPTAALAADGFYVGAGAGVNLLRDADSTFTGDTTADETLDFETGFAGALSAGYKFGFGLRPELELSYRRNRLDAFDESGLDANDGAVRSLALLANVVYDINTGTAFTPYIGAGIGFARLWADDIRDGADIVRVDDSDNVLAYQGIVGVSYAATENLNLTLDYRYFATKDPKFSASTGAGAAAGTGFDRLDTEYRNHTILAGLRYSFGAAPVAPAPTPAPAPAPQVQAQREFLVFFDWNKSDITPLAGRTISDTAATAGATRTVRLDVVGHTDTSGSPDYNLALSKRRAEAVKAELVRRGVPEGNVVIAWRGESQPLVATADGVREPSNRRASISLTIQ